MSISVVLPAPEGPSTAHMPDDACPARGFDSLGFSSGRCAAASAAVLPAIPVTPCTGGRAQAAQHLTLYLAHTHL